MEWVGKYIEYQGESYIVVAFDGTFYYLVSEETARTAKCDGDLFTLVTQEELEEEIESGRIDL